MRVEAAMAALKLFGANSFDKSTLPWLTTACPLAPWDHAGGVDKNPSFAVLTGVKGGRCNCFSCGFKGNLESLAGAVMLKSKLKVPFKMMDLYEILENDVDLGPISFSGSGEREQYSKPIPFPEEWLRGFPSLMNNYDAYYRYVEDRGFHAFDMKQADMRADHKRRRVCFPVRGFDGKLYGLRGRAIDPDNKVRYWAYDCGNVYNPTVMLGEHHLDTDKPIVVCEGPFDYLKIRCVYDNVVCPFTVSITQAQIYRLTEAYMLVAMGDGNVAGSKLFPKLQGMASWAKVIDAQLDEGLDPGGADPSYLRTRLMEAGCPLDD